MPGDGLSSTKVGGRLRPSEVARFVEPVRCGSSVSSLARVGGSRACPRTAMAAPADLGVSWEEFDLWFREDLVVFSGLKRSVCAPQCKVRYIQGLTSRSILPLVTLAMDKFPFSLRMVWTMRAVECVQEGVLWLT